jgi:hypothetical protein
MDFRVEVERRIEVRQGLTSPVRARRGLAPIPAGEGTSVLVKAGVVFDEGQLDELGRFVDTDLVAEELDHCCARLTGQPWADLFAFRPTFELVARHVYRELAGRVPQVGFVELRDETFGVTTRYEPPTGSAGSPVSGHA